MPRGPVATRRSAFANAAGFQPKAGRYLALPGVRGALRAVLFGLGGCERRDATCSCAGSCAGLLPPGTYRFANAPHDARLAALAFALGAYRFDRYRKARRPAT